MKQMFIKQILMIKLGYYANGNGLETERQDIYNRYHCNCGSRDTFVNHTNKSDYESFVILGLQFQ